MAFEQFCVVELFGHQKVAGKVTEQQIGGASFVRVDVPATRRREGFTKYYHPNAIYALTPVDEAVANAAAENIDPAPVRKWELALPQLADEVVRGGDPDFEDQYGNDEDHGF